LFHRMHGIFRSHSSSLSSFLLALESPTQESRVTFIAS
jgi:hypothetical protein